MCLNFACTYVCASCVYLVSNVIKKGYSIPCSVVIDNCQLPYVYWELNSVLRKKFKCSSASG